jgi:hypothetical protein
MLAGHYDAKMILFHVYEYDENADEVQEALRKLKDYLMDEALVKMDCVAVRSDDFIGSLEKKIRGLDCDLVVMAVNEKETIDGMISPSNSLRLIEKNLCPVLVIPFNAHYNAIKNIAVASDFKDVRNAIPLAPVKKLLNLFKPNLHIVNINSEIYVSLTEEQLEQRSAMLEMFEEFNPEFYFITTYDFHETLRQFIDDKNIDMVLTFPRKHSFINNLIKGTNTKKLVHESAIPILAAHE